MENEEYLEGLARDLYRAKQAEETAKNERIRIENLILEAVEMPETGTKTVKVGALKLALKKENSYAVDEKGLFAAGLPTETVRSLFEEVPASLKFVPKQYESLRQMDPSVFSEVAKYVTVKPRKPSVALKI